MCWGGGEGVRKAYFDEIFPSDFLHNLKSLICQIHFVIVCTKRASMDMFSMIFLYIYLTDTLDNMQSQTSSTYFSMNLSQQFSFNYVHLL